MKRFNSHSLILLPLAALLVWGLPAGAQDDDDIYFTPKKNTFKEADPVPEGGYEVKPYFREEDNDSHNRAAEQSTDSSRQSAYDQYEPDNFERPADNDLYEEEQVYDEGYDVNGDYYSDDNYDYGARLRGGNSPAYGFGGYYDGYYTDMYWPNYYYDPFYAPFNNFYMGYGGGGWQFGLGFGLGYGWNSWNLWGPSWYYPYYMNPYRIGWGYGYGFYGNYWNNYCGPYWGGVYLGGDGSSSGNYYGHRNSTSSSHRPESRGNRSESTVEGARLKSPDGPSIVRSSRIENKAETSPRMDQPRSSEVTAKPTTGDSRPSSGKTIPVQSSETNVPGSNRYNSAGRAAVQEEKKPTTSGSSAPVPSSGNLYRPSTTRSDYRPSGSTTYRGSAGAGTKSNTSATPAKPGSNSGTTVTPRPDGYQYNERSNSYNRPSNTYSKPAENNQRSINRPSSGTYSTPSRSTARPATRPSNGRYNGNGSYQRPSSTYSRPNTGSSPARQRPAVSQPSYNQNSAPAPSRAPSNVAPRSSSPSSGGSGTRSGGSSGGSVRTHR